MICLAIPQTKDLPANRLPVENETPDVSADEDADDDVAVVVHGQPVLRSAIPTDGARSACAEPRRDVQHHKVGDSKLHHM